MGVAPGDYRDRIGEGARGFAAEGAAPLAELPFVPGEIFKDFSTDDAQKPTAVHLFREDFGPESRIQFGGKFKGRWTVKFNAVMKVEGSTNNRRLFLLDEVQVKSLVAETHLQPKLNPELFSAQMDFGPTFFQTDYDTAQGALRVNPFLNPYIYFESDRAFNNQPYGLGLVYYFNTVVRKNLRLNFYKRENVLTWNMQCISFYNYKGMFVSLMFALTYNDFFVLKNRRMMLDYHKNEVNAHVELGFEGGSVKRWNLSGATATVAHNFREKGLLELFFRSSFMRDTAAPLNEFGLGYANRLKKDLDVKATLSLSGLLNLFLNYRLEEGLHMQPSLMTSISSPGKKGFLILPFNFGLKIKLER